MTTTTTYEVKVYVAVTWATGALMRTGMRSFLVEEESSILGGCRAIDKAIAQCGGKDMCDVHSPEISPNPAELGWALQPSLTSPPCLVCDSPEHAAIDCPHYQEDME